MEILDRPKLLYPSLVIAAIAVTVFSLLGIATLTGALPFAHSEMREATAAKTQAESDRMTSKKLAATCPSCGTVESVHAVQVKGEGSGVGIVAGGIAGALLGNGIGRGAGRSLATVAGAAGGAYAGNEIEKNTKKHISYRIRVRMSDGSIRTLHQSEAPGVSAGDRVKIVDGTIVQLS
ncbi:conserved protein of unknown function [Georgfuchsia toluolica]|uniref:Glycine zipper 2TM domain-containing protein n=1 Tax=Georgfuchsia toluolica TaxID=424218 RepID=A0A916N9B5_9PROT|nr:glycine zipper 2TM domain-containing protein [Georgfuchsia toluolica]CAG4884337.1 conserved protein of unknown function [Georgfuchsia toluolica]